MLALVLVAAAALFAVLGVALTRVDVVELAFTLVLRPFGRWKQHISRRIRGGYGVLYIGEGGLSSRLRSPPPQAAGVVRCVCISDTHLLHHTLDLPAGDVLVHCGDMLLQSRAADDASMAQLAEFGRWMQRQRHGHKLVVGGNHDGAVAALGAEAVQKMLPGAKYLEDDLVQVCGLRVYGSPLSVGHSKNCAFQPHSGYNELAAAAAIPEGLDLLITHGPPGRTGRALGRASAALEERVRAVQPRYHIFGHYHLGYGLSQASAGGAVSVNVSSADAFFALSHPPVVLDIRPLAASGRR